MSLSLTAETRSRRQTAYLNITRFSHLTVAGFAAQWMFCATVLAYGAVGWLLVFRLPGADQFNTWRMVQLFVVAAVPAMTVSALLALALFRFHHLVTKVKPERPLSELFKVLKTDVSDVRRYVIGLPMFLAIFAFMCVFGQLKANIPVVNPFSWDETFMSLDQWLHFGEHPWKLLQPIVGHPIVTFFISKCYVVWLIVTWMVWMWLAFDTRLSHLRTRFFASFMLTWILGGSVLAFMLSSAGPVFYSNLGLSPDPYAGLMSYLRSVHAVYPVDALPMQDMLWGAYIGENSLVAGISAMPSMHNATALLFVLAVWPVNRKLGIAFALYAFVIFIGSIHLGWHYAADTYLAYAVTLTCWWLGGRFASWHDARPAYRKFQTMLEVKSEPAA